MLFNDREDNFTEEALKGFSTPAYGAEEKFETILGERNTVTGNIEGASPICINGKLKGNINSTSYVYISKTGKVEGDVVANHLVLLGAIDGQKVNVEKLVVTSTGVLNSDLTVAKLTVEEGGVLNGQITVNPVKAAPKAEAPAKK